MIFAEANVSGGALPRRRPRAGVTRNLCKSCGKDIESPLFREWICAPCRASAKRAKRVAAKDRPDRIRCYAPRRRTHGGVLPHEVSDWTWTKIARQNAKDAWEYWINTKSPKWWREASEAKAKEMAGPPRPTASERFRIRYRTDPEFRLKQILRNYRRKAERGRYGEAVRQALKASAGSAALERKLGVSVPDLRRHLERQFKRGMSWERFARGEIHIDHIVPLSSFDLRTEAGLRAAWSLSNLRPLWAKDNLKKGAKRLFLL